MYTKDKAVADNAILINLFMKILFCVEFYNPNKGGVQYHTELIVDKLLKDNCDIQIATNYDKNRDLKKFKYPIHQFKCAGNIVSGFKGKDIINYQNFLINSNFDLIIFYAAQQWSLDAALPILHLIKAKKILLPCGFSKINAPIYWAYYYILKKKLVFFDKIICFSKHTKDYLILKVGFAEKIEIIPNAGNDFSKITICKKKKDYIRILNVANFTFLKNQIYIIFLSLFFKNKFKIYFIHSKNSYYKMLCKKLCSIIEVFFIKKKYVFLNNLSKNKINKFYMGSDFFLFTSLIECSPLVIYDCLTSGLPFIAPDVGNCKEISSKTKNSHIYKKFFHCVKLVNCMSTTNSNIYNSRFTWERPLKDYAKLFINIQK